MKETAKAIDYTEERNQVKNEEVYLNAKERYDTDEGFDDDYDYDFNDDIENDSYCEAVDFNGAKTMKNFNIKNAIFLIPVFIIIIIVIIYIGYSKNTATKHVEKAEGVEVEEVPEVIRIKVDEAKSVNMEPVITPPAKSEEVSETQRANLPVETMKEQDFHAEDWLINLANKIECSSLVVWNEDSESAQIIRTLEPYEVNHGDKFAIVSYFEIGSCEYCINGENFTEVGQEQIIGKIAYLEIPDCKLERLTANVTAANGIDLGPDKTSSTEYVLATFK